MRFRARTRLARLERLVDPMILVVPPGFGFVGGLDGWVGLDFFDAGTFWGLLGHGVGWLGRSVRGLEFGGLGLCLSIVMLESRHRKWQGANVSNFWGVRCLVRPSVALRLAQDERTGGVGIGWGGDFRPLAPLGVTEGGRGDGGDEWGGG